MERPKGPEQSTEAGKQAPDARVEREGGVEAQKATKDIRDIARSLTSAERLLTSSSSLNELRNDTTREALKAKRAGIGQRLKKFSAVALAGMVSLGALLQGGAEGHAEDKGRDESSEAAESAPVETTAKHIDAKETEQERSENVGITEDERAALLGLVLAISEQLRQDKYPHEVGQTDEEDEEGEGASGWSGDPSDPFSEAHRRELEMQQKIDEMDRTITQEQSEQGKQEMEDHATDQVSAYVNETLASRPEHFAEMLRLTLKNGQYIDLDSVTEAPDRGVEQGLFEQKMAEALVNLRTDVESKMRDPSATMTEAERRIAAVLAEEDARKRSED